MQPKLKLLSGLTALFISLAAAAGCAKHPDAVYCPTPAAPELPVLDTSKGLANPSNIRLLLIRDDALRQYIEGLRATVKCYDGQFK